MKKALSLFLAIIFCFTMAVPSMAAITGTVGSITLKAPANAAQQYQDLTIKLTNVDKRARVSADRGRIAVFLNNNSTITFSRDVNFSRITEKNGTRETTPLGKYEGGKTYTYTEYKSIFDNWFKGESSFSFTSDSFASISDAANYENNYKDFTEVDITTLATGAVTTAAPATNNTSAILDKIEIKIPDIDNLHTIVSVTGNNTRIEAFKDMVISISGGIDHYYYSEGMATVSSPNSPYHFGEKNYIFVIPNKGSFSFSRNILGWKDSESNMWDSMAYKANTIADTNTGSEAVIKLRFENNSSMKADPISAANVFFILTNDTSKSYGEKRPINDLATTPIPVATPESETTSTATQIATSASVPKAKVVPEITIEIPGSNGTQFTLTNIYDGFIDTSNNLNGELLFANMPGSTLICNKDIFLYEFIASNNGMKFYHYHTFKSTREGKLLETFPAGTSINFNSMLVAHTEFDLNEIIVVSEKEGDERGSGRQIHFYPAEEFFEWENDEEYPYEFFPMSTVSVATSSVPTPTPAATTSAPSDWAKANIDEGIASGLIPSELQTNYTGNVSRIEVAQLIVNLIEKATGKTADALISEKGATLGSFNDTTDKNILAANALGIISGTGEGNFSPDSQLTRAQLAAIISRIAKTLDYNIDGYPAVDFSDTEGHWVNNELPFSVAVGIFSGVGDNKFAPDAPLTVEQLGAVAVRTLKYFNENPAQ